MPGGDSLAVRFYGGGPYGDADLLVPEERSPVRTAALAGRLGISRREAEMLALVAEGKSNDEIAAALAISPHTVEKHVGQILDRLGVANRAAAARWTDTARTTG